MPNTYNKMSTIKIDLDTEELKDDPWIIPRALNLYAGRLKQGLYRFMVIGKDTQQIYLDHTTKLYFDFKNRGGLTSSPFWNENKFSLGFVDSQETIYQLTDEDKVLIITGQTRIDPSFFIQRFLRASIGHCFFNPMIKFFEDKKNNKHFKSAYNKIIDYTQKSGKEKKGYISKYSSGVPENEIQKICDDLKIGVDIEQPLNNNFISIRPEGRCRKVFKYINTLNNHIDQTNENVSWNNIYLNEKENPTILEPEKMIEKYNELTRDKIPFIYSEQKDVIKTPTEVFQVNHNPFPDFDKFEKNQGLNNYGFLLDFEKHYEIKIWLKEAMKYNGTVDFYDTKFHRDKTTEEIKKMDIYHFDQTKAYSQFKQSKYYSGFVGKLTDFRKVNNYNQKGFYRIQNLDISKTSKKFQYYEKHLSIFHNDNIYTDAELHFLKDQGAKFKVIDGLYGVKMDFEFTEDMMKQTPNPKYKYKKNFVPKYSYWTGLKGKITEGKTFYMNGDIEYFQNLKGDILYDHYHKRARLTEPKKKTYTHIHIASQITAYQRLNMYEQLLEVDHKKVIRVCVDGFYTYEKNPKLINKFRPIEQKLTFSNFPCKCYCFNINSEDILLYNLPTAPPREHYTTEIHIGQGGNGKTYSNLKDEGFINLTYIAPSYKLSSNKSKEFNINADALAQITGARRTQDNFKYFNVLVVDEASMINEDQKKYIFQNFKGKIIFCGDIGFQLPPIEGKPININSFENIVNNNTKNYRFEEGDKIIELVKILRDFIELNKSRIILKENIQKLFKLFNVEELTIEELQKVYKKEEMIITATHTRKNLFTQLFKHLNKYYILERKKGINKGDITTDEKLEVEKELRHGYTIHSIQGETIKNTLYIDINKGMSLKSLYTAVSRVKTINNIKIII